MLRVTLLCVFIYLTGMGGRTVQKYLEFPLLAPSSANVFLRNAKFSDSAGDAKFVAKFDMRVWVLVTSFQRPVTAYIYSQHYGRRCSTEYNTSVSTINDSYAHLTNYSVQKKQKFNNSNNSASNNSNAMNSNDQNDAFNNNAPRKLRNVCNSFRGGSSKNEFDGNNSNTANTDGKSAKSITEADLLICK